ncbi:MAG: helix-turn-helix domain-containing protein [Prevotella sp.]
MANAVEHMSADDMGDDELTHRKIHLFNRFMQMVMENAHRERKAEFYAQSLCITPQYLGRIVREMSHETAYGMISRMATGKMKTMLEQPDKSVQQIAAELGFADQSAFTKYFRRNTGLTPLKYRNSI